MEHWKGWLRTDGLRVSATRENTWVVVPTDDRAAVTTCPCCVKPMVTREAAQRVADAVYPMQGKRP
jgi:hypothetical protein